MNLTHRLAIIVAIEIVYMAATRITIHYLPWASVEAELIRTALRIATATIYWQLMKPLILSKKPNLGTRRRTSLIIGLLLFFSVPVLVGYDGLNAKLALLFSITSIPVGIKEELLFRGILQNFLEEKWGSLAAIFITSAIFSAWHIGVAEPIFWVFAQIFLVSILLGFIYIRTGSIVLVIVLHALYDALFAFTPFLSTPANGNLAVIILLISVLLVFRWAHLDRSIAKH